MASLARSIMDYLGDIQTWVWLWGLGGMSTVIVAVWGYISRLPGVVVFVLALAAGALTMITLETALVVREKIREYSGARYRRAVAALDGFRTTGVVLRDRPVTSDAELKTFVDDLATWEAGVITAMQNVAARTDVAWFRDLHQWTVLYGVSAYNTEHAVKKAALDEKLRRMHIVANKLEAKISD